LFLRFPAFYRNFLKNTISRFDIKISTCPKYFSPNLLFFCKPAFAHLQSTDTFRALFCIPIFAEILPLL
jgi:hypothetical protein